MEVVYLARDFALDRPVAIKLLPPELAASRELRERFLREARTAAQLSHPHIVPIHSVAEHDSLDWNATVHEPEQARGERVDARSDLYSLGATIFFALTERLPVEAPTLPALLSRHGSAEPIPSVTALRAALPAPLAAAVDHGLRARSSPSRGPPMSYTTRSPRTGGDTSATCAA